MSPAREERWSLAAGDRIGTGFGLAIVATIATAHHGSTTVSNAHNGGAEIVIRLPDDQLRLGRGG